ncbi:MAG: hypothetical protein NCW75_08615 [Phycisphaera sp.]|nr:MAG: hypothetical protein NCW75_08615 [Phycisphaera sp.]
MALSRSTVSCIALVAGLGLSTALAQVQTVAYTTYDDDPFGANSTDAGVSVNAQAVLTTSNMRVSLFSRNGSLLNSRQVGGTNPNPWPFTRADPLTTMGPSRFFDPQTVYHPQSGRLWMLYSEENTATGSGQNDISPLHIAVSKAMTGSDTLDTFDAEDWWYYTGTSGARPIFNLQDTMTKYRNVQGLHDPFGGAGLGLLDKPHFAVDEQAAYVTMNGNALIGGGNFNAIAIIPTTHGTTSNPLSILDGDKPSSGDMVFLRNPDLRPVPDNHQRHYTVQEPFEQVDNAQFILSLNPAGEIGDPTDSIRLAGLWFNDSPPSPESPRWEYSQRVKFETGSTTVLEIDDMNFANAYEFRGGSILGGGTYQPMTPDSGFRPAAAAATTFFPSAVLVKINNNDWRIFAVHHVRPVDSSDVALNQWIIQWYVIDPDLANFRSVDPVSGSTPSTAWKPTVETTGRLDTAGERYHPVIGVTEQGVAYIEYTYSSTTVWPEVRRATLNSSYTAIVSGSETTVQAGPLNEYDGARWADFADMQADPVTGCAFWSTHTLVHQNDITINDKRDVWLFQSVFNCGNSNLNFDGGTDLYDMAMFNSLYSTGARRVDMNTDGTTDATDAAIYADEYDKATGP